MDSLGVGGLLLSAAASLSKVAARFALLERYLGMWGSSSSLLLLRQVLREEGVLRCRL